MLETLAQATAALLARSAYQPPLPGPTYGLDEREIERMRRQMGGQIQPLTVSQTRWYLADLEGAEFAADNGDIGPAARLMRAARKDGRLAGVLSTRTGGLVRLPKVFRGDPEIIRELEPAHDGGRNARARSVFDEMFPPAELAMLAADGIFLGVAVGEFVPVEGRDYPVLVRLDPEFLFYRWNENRWYFRSIAGSIPITPGDGRWFLHTPGGRMCPWQNGLWRCIGRSYIRKEHALLHKDNYEAKLANPARVAVSPTGAGEEQKDSWFRQVMAWGVNTVFGMPQGYDVKLVESNGRGWECFDTTIAECNTDMIIAIAGQTVTVDGGAGFQNSDIHKTIRADLIKETADGLAHSINTQGIPPYIAARYGIDAIETRACLVDWDVTPPKDRNSEAQSLVTTADAFTRITAALHEHDRQVDVDRMCTTFAVPTLRKEASDVDDTTDPEAALDAGQIDSLRAIIADVAAELIPRDSALAIIQVAFNVDESTADKMLGSVGKGFVPAALPSDADGGDPFTDDEGDDVIVGDDALDDDVDDELDEVAA